MTRNDVRYMLMMIKQSPRSQPAHDVDGGQISAQIHRQPPLHSISYCWNLWLFHPDNMMLLKFSFVLSLISLSAGFCPIPYIAESRYVTISRPVTTSLSVAVDTSEIKNGMTLEVDGEPYKVLSFSIMKQARGAAKTTIKMKNLIRGTTIENTYRSGEKFETALIEKSDHQFTYEEGVSFLQHQVGWIRETKY
jgi:hypothetical protein